MEDSVYHQGIIENISDGRLTVRILQESACSSCKVKKLCSSSESKEKLIDVSVADCNRYSVGQNVVVYSTLSMGMKAVVIAFAIPALILILGIYIPVSFLNISESASIGISLSLLAIYYFVVWMLNDKIAKVITFKLKG